MTVNEAKKILLAAPLNPTEKVALNVLLAELDIEDLPSEIWRNVGGFEEFYQISTYGRIKSFHKGTVRIMKLQVTRDGYLRVELHGGGKKRKTQVHILVAEAFIPNPAGKPQVNHIDGKKSNNCVENLEWVTASENIRHSVRTGLQRSGCDCPISTLTAEQIHELRRDYKPHDKQFGLKAFAKKFGRSKTTIQKALTGKRYKNVI